MAPKLRPFAGFSFFGRGAAASGGPAAGEVQAVPVPAGAPAVAVPAAPASAAATAAPSEGAGVGASPVSVVAVAAAPVPVAASAGGDGAGMEGAVVEVEVRGDGAVAWGGRANVPAEEQQKLRERNIRGDEDIFEGEAAAAAATNTTAAAAPAAATTATTTPDTNDTSSTRLLPGASAADTAAASASADAAAAARTTPATSTTSPHQASPPSSPLAAVAAALLRQRQQHAALPPSSPPSSPEAASAAKADAAAAAAATAAASNGLAVAATAAVTRGASAATAAAAAGGGPCPLRELATPPPPRKKTVSYENLVRTKKVGRGQFGDVWRVTTKQSAAEIYALKVVSYCTSKEEVKNITWSKRPKRHLLTSHTAYWSQSSNKVCILMEYMPYGSLQEFTEHHKRNKRMVTWRDVHIVAISISDGLLCLEKRHMVHRDIKPANILIGAGGIVKIGDFGISRMTEKNDNSQAYTQVGSEMWLSPERLAGDGYSYPSDVYSLGLVIAYLALNGQKPLDAFNEERQISLAQLMQERLHTGIGRPPEQLDPAVGDLVFRCTAVDPAERPTAEPLLRAYRSNPEFRDLILSGSYGIDVSTISPFHEDDLLYLPSSPALERQDTTESTFVPATPVDSVSAVE